MSKSSATSAQKIPTQLPLKSAWSRGPPQNTSSPTPRSQSPAPTNSVHPTHSRRPSALGQAVPIKDGVSVARNNVGAVKQGASVTFGSIDDAAAPISSSPAAAPPIKSESIRSFGSVSTSSGHVNGKPSISSKPPLAAPSSSSTTSAATPSPAPSTPSPAPSSTPSKPAKTDILKMFQNPSSGPSTMQNPPGTSSPSLKSSTLPSQTPLSSSSSQQSSAQPQQHGSPFPTFVPQSGIRQPSSSVSGGAPRSPVYARPLPNGSGSRPPPGPSSGPPQMSPGMSSPRLGPHTHSGPPSTMPPPPPPMQPQIAMQWPGYFYPEQHFMPYSTAWYMPQQMPPQPQHSPHHPQPSGPHAPPHTGIPMSPRNPPTTLQPGTPTPAHAIPSSMHVPHPPAHAHTTSNSISSISSPPPTPASASIPGSARLNANSTAFVPGSRSKVTIRDADGRELDLGSMRKTASTATSGAAPPSESSSGFRQGGRPTSVRLETEEQRKKRLAEEKERAKAKADAEERDKREKEEKQKKQKEEERKRREQEEAEKERERIRKEEDEKERLRKEDEEKERQRKETEEAERLRKEEEEKERAKKDEEERIRREEEEIEKQRQLQLEEEEKRRKEEEEKERRRLEEEAAATAAAQKQEAQVPESKPESPAPAEESREEGEVSENQEEPVAVATPAEDAKEKSKESLRINTATPSEVPKKRPGRLDLSHTKAVPSALSTARVIEDLDQVSYPDGVMSPKPELNVNAKDGKFRYDRDFLLQFMSICKEKPEMLPPLDAIGLEPVDQASLAMSRTSSGRHRQSSSTIAPPRQASLGLGISSGGFGKIGGSMGNFATPGASKLSSDERFNIATGSRAASMGAGMQFRPSPMQRTASQGGPGGVPMSNNRTRSKRGEKRGDGSKAAGAQQGHGFGHGPTGLQQTATAEPVAPLQVSANRWDRKTISSVDPDSPEIVDRKVKGLLNKLTMERFDSISDQIIAWANKSEKEKDGRTLIQVIRLVFEKATDEATWSEMYARLCRKMMEQISPQVQDQGIKNAEGKPIAGGQLFRKYLLNRCQEDFERGWVAKEATAAAAATKAMEDQAVKAANEKSKEGGSEEIVLYSDEYYAAQKAKRQGLGLIKFIGELFKLQMLTERIMHECIKKLLGNVDNPEEEEIESLCKLLTTVGSLLDTPKARAHMDVYFTRMKELTKSLNVSPRMQFMLQDVIELRERKWVARNAVIAPGTIAQIHEAAAKEKANQEKESYQRQLSMSRGGSRRGGDRSEYTQDGWAVAGNGPQRPATKAGDLSNFGKISKGTPMTFGPSSVFAGKKDSKRDSLSRTSSSSNMFSMLSQSPEAAAEVTSVKGSRPPSRKTSVDFSQTAAPEAPAQRKRLILQPRSKPLEEQETPAAPSAEPESSEDEGSSKMTEEQAKTKIEEDSKEFFGVRNLDEAEVYFAKLPTEHHPSLVNKLASTAVESKEADAQLASDFFARAASKQLCSASAFEEGLALIAEIIDDIAIDAPKAFAFFATIIRGTGLDDERRQRLASKSLDSDKLLSLLS